MQRGYKACGASKLRRGVIRRVEPASSAEGL